MMRSKDTEFLPAIEGSDLIPAGTVNGSWMPTAVFDTSTGVTREKLQKAFAAENIDARVFFRPLSSLPMFEDQPQNRLAWDIPGRAINLPSYHDLTLLQQNNVVNIVLRTLDIESKII